MSAIEEEYSKLHPKRNIAVAGLINPVGEILLIRTHNLPDTWQPIGGGINEGESPEDAVAREANEELSIDIDARKSIFNTTAAYDFGEGTVYFYTLPISVEAITLLSINTNEIAEARWFTLEDVVLIPCYPATSHYLQAYAQHREQHA